LSFYFIFSIAPSIIHPAEARAGEAEESHPLGKNRNFSPDLQPALPQRVKMQQQKQLPPQQ
jgi:hypothetical protein